MKRIILRLFILLFAVTLSSITACSKKTGDKKDDIGQEENGEQKLAQIDMKELYNNDFILYKVNCGASQSDSMGLYQSSADQVFGMDLMSGAKWGYIDRSEMQAEGDLFSDDFKESKWVIEKDAEYVEDTGIYYEFQLPKGEYDVTAGFYNPFSARTIDIDGEGIKQVSELKILKYKLIEADFKIEVSDGFLNLKIYNTKRNNDFMKNPEVSYIIIRAVPEYDKDYLALLLSDIEVELNKAKTYREESYQDFLELHEKALNSIDDVNCSDGDIAMLYMTLDEAFRNLEEIEIYSSFHPGKPWNDMDGDLIQAHGGQVQRLNLYNDESGKYEDVWWWVGEDKSLGYRGGIRAYSSKDLYNWKFEGVVMRNVSSRESLNTDEYFLELYDGYTNEQLDNVYRCINDTTSVIERPKMIYNEATKQYVIWFHADGPTETSDANYAAAAAGVAVSDSPIGPFRFIDRYRLNTCPEGQTDMYPESKGMARDMNLFVDDDKTAYIIYSSEENLTMYIARLDETYTYLDVEPEKAVHGIDFVRLFPGAQREAPAVFKRNQKYYMMTSGATGWDPNPARYFMADEIFGEWKDMGDPCIDDKKRTTFDSQSTCIFNIGDDQYIYMGDRWNKDDLARSRYVWLPILFNDNGSMEIEWVDSFEY